MGGDGGGVGASMRSPWLPNLSSDEKVLDDSNDKLCISFPHIESIHPNLTTHLAHIPPKLWQIYLPFTSSAIEESEVTSWLVRSPSHAYTMLDAAGAVAFVSKLAKLGQQRYRFPSYRTQRAGGNHEVSAQRHGPYRYDNDGVRLARDAVSLYYSMTRHVLRVDFLRYLVLALEGGIYADVDVRLVKPIREWVPEEYREQTRLIVGLEADQSPPVDGTKYEVQFCQWTLASAANHPALWAMIDRILDKVHNKSGLPYYSDDDVLEITGPAGFTEVIFEHLNYVSGPDANITWRNLTGMTEPRLFGDILILPIDAFGTGLPHSNASGDDTAQTLTRHEFRGSWRGEQD